MRRRVRAAGLLLVPLLLTPVAARAASFDCKKAATAIETLVCSDAGLSELDGKLADSYQLALAVASRPEALKAEQRAWLAKERARCTDVACLREAYQRRLVTLSRLADQGFTAAAGQEASYSFKSAPFVNPHVVDDLATWESDHGDQIVAINLTDSQRSNRYFADARVRRNVGSNPYVFYHDGESEFGYRYVGRTTGGVDVLLTSSSGGGSGNFGNLMLVALRMEPGGMTPDLVLDSGTVSFTRKRLILEKLGEIGLGDRWSGDVQVKGDEITIGANRSPMPGDDAGTTRVIKVDYRREHH